MGPAKLSSRIREVPTRRSAPRRWLSLLPMATRLSQHGKKTSISMTTSLYRKLAYEAKDFVPVSGSRM